jgi:Uma2 family endonuclease
MSTTTKVAYDEYCRLAESGAFEGLNRRRVELIRGEIIDMNPIGHPHEFAVDQLTEWSFKNAPLGEVRVRIQNSIGLPELESLPEPDVAWVERRPRDAGRPEGRHVKLLIEVAESSLVRDAGLKKHLYAEAGIADYWIVNLREQRIEVYRDPQAGDYASKSMYTEGEVALLAYPQISLPVGLPFGDES